MAGYPAATHKKSCIVIVALVLVLAGIALAIDRPPSFPLWIRISGVAPFVSPMQPGGWRMEVPTVKGKFEMASWWLVSIQETNADTVAGTVLKAVADSDRLYSWRIRQSEGGIVTGSGPKPASGKAYRAIGAFSRPPFYGKWLPAIWQSPFRPVLRFVPEPTPHYATSEWVRVQFPEGIGTSQGALTNGATAPARQAK